MDIPALSISMNQARLKQEVGISLAKKVIDSAKEDGANLLKMMDANTKMMEQLDPNVGSNVGVRA